MLEISFFLCVVLDSLLQDGWHNLSINPNPRTYKYETADGSVKLWSLDSEEPIADIEGENQFLELAVGEGGGGELIREAAKKSSGRSILLLRKKEEKN